MRKFLCKVAVFLGVCLLLTILPCVLIDPYNVFHWDNVRENGVEPNKNYIKVKYILANPDKFDTYLFGSSRGGVIHTENFDGENCYNMSYSEGIPKEYLDNLKTFIENGVTVKKVYISLDSLGCTIAPKRHYNGMRCPYEKMNLERFIEYYLTPSTVFDSLDTMFAARNVRTENYNEIFYKYGWWCDYGEETISEDEVDELEPYIGYDDYFEKNLKAIEDIKELCEENSIEVVFFTNPMYDITYTESVDEGYYDFLKELAEITDYMNFSCLNEITTDITCYLDSSHYTPELADEMMNIIREKEEPNEELVKTGYGYYTTKDNVDELVDILYRQYVPDEDDE
ncbi:MAG: DUF1574 domain-containing protein [Lachnospiraceae bacterium]|nr:DUF1574 domain-containing protein [Lachnospiraceae bacterium]